MLTPALETYPHAGERGAQVMRDVIADTGNLMNQSFNFAQHAVDADGELVERIIAPADWQAFAQVPRYNTLDFPVDLREPIAST